MFSFNGDIVAGQNTKRESGRKVQLDNISAGKVRIAPDSAQHGIFGVADNIQWLNCVCFVYFRQ